MFNIESYVTPILLSYVDKYVRDFRPVDAQVSLWKGGVTLHNLVLKADVLQQELALPFTLVSGRIHELLIQVPWTKIMSEPIVVTIKTIECILSLNPPPDDSPQQETQSSRTQVVEAPSSYMQELVRSVVSNIAIRVQSLIVKYVHDDIVMSLNVKHLAIDSVGCNWEPTFADIDQNQPAIRRLVRLDDLTLCLDKSDSDGKIRFFNEPLLYRCQLELRVLTRLISAHTRRARSLSVQLLSSRLAWSVNNEQLVLLLRLMRERIPAEAKSPSPVAKQSNVQATPMNAATSSSAEPARKESWSEWAFSWLPTLDSEGVEETPAPATPVPVAFTAHFDHVSLVFKIMELDATNRKRPRAILDLTATDAVIKSYMCSPTFLRMKIGTRFITLSTHGKCVCGVLDASVNSDQPTIYLKKIEGENEEPWSWMEEELIDQMVETAVAVDEEFKGSPEGTSEATEQPNVDTSGQDAQAQEAEAEQVDEFWQKMAPVIYFEYNHDRSPSDTMINPYDNPPRDYEYSDWIEESNLTVFLRPISIDISIGLIHRLTVLRNVLKEMPILKQPEAPKRTLTVEECEALSENLPVRHTNIDISGLRIRVIPSNHTTNDNTGSPLVLDLQLPNAYISITSPLYPNRVCSAACQMLDDSGTLWQGARLHISADIDSLQAGICSSEEDSPRACARAKMRFVTHSLLNSALFKRAESVLFGYILTIREANLCGSAARLQAAYHVLQSLMNEKLTYALQHTTLAQDALSDEASVAIDVTLEELSLRGYITKNINTHFITLNSAKATAFHLPNSEGGELKQAWLFSAPETPTSTPYLRTAVQWCKAPNPSCLEFIKVTVEPTALSVDPLLVSWLGYRPNLNPGADSVPDIPNVKSTPLTQYLFRRRTTPPSSSGRGGSRSGSAAELVHGRPMSLESSSERSERNEPKRTAKVNPVTESWWSGEYLLKLHDRLNRLLLVAEVGLIQLYVTPTSVSALDCASVRDAMERHAITNHQVFVVNLGRMTMHSSAQTRHLWQEVRYDRPTYQRRDPDAKEDSFPWKARVADVSCYTLEARAETESSGTDKSTSGLKSPLKASRMAIPRTVLDLITTTVTLSIVIKYLEKKSFKKPDKPKHTDDEEDDSTKYFTTGIDFQPSTLKEFIRGPIRRRRTSPEPEDPEPSSSTAPNITNKTGPIVSIGVCIHADTPPTKFRLDQDQVQTVAVAMHCISHVLTLLLRPAVSSKQTLSCFGCCHRSLGRSMSELEARQSLSEETPSDDHSEQLISIFEAKRPTQLDTKIKTFFWFQWVVSRATLIVTSPEVKVVFDVDDIITTMDLQNQYNQMKLKVASASIKHYKRTDTDEWIPGALGGRILEVREPANAKEENHFLAITVTQARISSLPANWKELYTKLLEQNSNLDSMWEVYATLAPLEAVLQPELLDHAISWLHELTPQGFCSLNIEETRPIQWQWPFLYVVAGGLRLLLINEEEKESTSDDTLMLVVGKVTVNPHPENPICRKSINAAAESTWTSSGVALDGLQYEVLASQISIRSAQFSQLANEEVIESEILKGTGGENPALKWSQPVVSPIVTPIVHPVNVDCVLAPAMYTCGAVTSGPAVELNLISDCSVELAVEQLKLVQSLTSSLQHLFRHRPESTCLHEEDATCPYAAILGNQDVAEPNPTETETTKKEATVGLNRNLTFDSGVETVSSQSTSKLRRDSAPMKKSVSIFGVDYTAKASDYLELFITMGVIDLSLYVGDDGSPEVQQLKPPRGIHKVLSEPKIKVIIDESKEKKDYGKKFMTASRSVTETTRNVDVGQTNLEQLQALPARKNEGNVALLHATIHQPNMYYWKRKNKKTFQMSLFNARIGLGVGLGDGHWNMPLLITTRGTADPITDILPALASLRIDLSTGYVPLSGSIGQGTVQLDIERPFVFEICMDRLRRLKGIMALIDKNISKPEVNIAENLVKPTPLLQKIRRFLVTHQIGSITMETNQIGLRGPEGLVGWEGLRVQSGVGARPDRIITRVLFTAATVSAGRSSGGRHVVLQPAMMGVIIDASWEAWRKSESLSARAPTVRVGIDLDHVILDLRPSDLVTLVKIQNILKDTIGSDDITSTPESSNSSTDYKNTKSSGASNMISFLSKLCDSSDTSELTHHYYKDDLRNGAFKIVFGDQLPMAYQVTLHGDTVSWRYPHPRAITRLMVYPIPGLDEEVECTLEFYCPMLNRWEPQTYFKLPVSDPREMQLSLMPQDSVFALMWRVRVCSDVERERPAFEFDSKKFMPRQDPLSAEPTMPSDDDNKSCNVSAEQLSGVLQVDSYFAPRLMPGARLTLRVALLEIHAHNSLTDLSKQTKLEGYYVSRPLIHSHRVLTLRVRDSAVHCMVASSTRLLLETHVSSDIIDIATGTMEQLIEEFRIQGSLCLSPEPRVRARAGDVRVALHVPRVATLRTLLEDWTCAYKNIRELKSRTQNTEMAEVSEKSVLYGRVSLWVHNECACALRIGQEGTDELITLGVGSSLAYRWWLPTAPKNLRFALANPSANWHWSTSIPFTEGKYRVRLEDGEMSSAGEGLFVHARVLDSGARRDMHLSGRLVLANMLRHNLLYLVRTRRSEEHEWVTISAGELQAESVGLSVICNCKYEAVLKVKFTSNETGWSGDIPLKECRKENVPWLVKVPSEGAVSYASVWCRVVRTDNAILATTWPFYVLRSRLPLDILISSVTENQTPQDSNSSPIVQKADGRGAVTHLITPGTTAARHMLTFKYNDIDCPVTREAIPLHYGVIETSVFDKYASVNNIEEVVDAMREWLVQSGRQAVTPWPYSIVTKHWPGTWQPALLQPRCEITIQYRAVQAGGGCSLELQLSPMVLLANASPITLTLRGHDAAPLCRLEPGVAIAPPTVVLEKPFFISVEMGRETFVSGQLCVSDREPGRYESPPHGHLVLDRAAAFAVQCNQKVALLTMYYEIKEDINVLGITSTYILLNRLSTDIMVSAVAVPNEIDKNTVLQPKTFKVIQPTRDGSLDGTPLSRFWMSNRWRGGNPDELRTFLCLALPSNQYPATTPVPIRLGSPPIRRAIALMDCNGQSIPIIISQVRHEGRWIITVAPDPCPQFVVHNRTKSALAVAQPITDASTLKSVQVVQECPGIKWWCVVKKNSVTHYSTPAHCARYPPPAHASPPSMPFLTVGHCRDETRYEWCQPIAIADGEQLLQLTGGITIKVRVRTHPHTSLIELLDVDQNDISASDIRRRLLGAFSEGFSQPVDEKNNGENVLPKVRSEQKLATKPLSTTQERLELSSRESQTLQGNKMDTNKKVAESGEIVIMAPGPSVQRDDSYFMKLSSMARADISEAYNNEETSDVTVVRKDSTEYSETSYLMEAMSQKEWSDSNEVWPEKERVRCEIESIAVTLGASADELPLIAAHLQRAALLVLSDSRKIRTTVSVADVQIDNAQYENEQYDFAVVAATKADVQEKETWPPLWGMFNDVISIGSNEARLLLRTCHDKWAAPDRTYQELTEVELKFGPVGLYIEDAFVGAAVDLYRLAVPLTAQTSQLAVITEINNLQTPLRLRKLHIHPLDLTLTLHTAVRMYIALDESPLLLSAFQLQDVMTSPERLIHAFTVHYLSAAILGAGWVVGGLELLGAPGALAARVGNAGGGVRGVASAAACALLRSLSAAAGSLARNLDLLAGDDDHARRAAAARRRPPPSLMAGLVTGVTNFAINILGAVGGLAHHPLVGVAVGESGSGATALRRGLVGAITKPLSATADLVAYAGQGLLTQTGWNLALQPKAGVVRSLSEPSPSGWRRDCVRWGFRLAAMNALAGFQVTLDNVPRHLLLTQKFLVLADPETEHVVEMINFKFCTLGSYQDEVIELYVSYKSNSKASGSRDVPDQDNEFQNSLEAMVRVARYTGVLGRGSVLGGARRVLALRPAPGAARALLAALLAAVRRSDDCYFTLL